MYLFTCSTKLLIYSPRVDVILKRVCLVPRRLSLSDIGRAREEGKAKGRETPGRLCFQDGGEFNGG